MQRDRPIGELTTYRVGGVAALYCEPGNVVDLEKIADVVGTTGVEVIVLGKGSNLLVADAGFCGLCVKLADSFATVEIDGVAVPPAAPPPTPCSRRRRQPVSPAWSGRWAYRARSEVR